MVQPRLALTASSSDSFIVTTILAAQKSSSTALEVAGGEVVSVASPPILMESVLGSSSQDVGGIIAKGLGMTSSQVASMSVPLAST